MKKTLAALLILCMVLTAAVSLAETMLPFGLSFPLTAEDVLNAVPEGAEWRAYGFSDASGVSGLDGMAPEKARERLLSVASEVPAAGWGTVTVENTPCGLGGLFAAEVMFSADTSNSARAWRFPGVYVLLGIDNDPVAAFREALTELTAVYGEPAEDPFREEARADYQEFGFLSADWVFPDCRVTLSLSHPSGEELGVSYTYRLKYDADDLK